MTKQEKAALANSMVFLAAIVTASAANEGTGYMFTSKEVHEPLVKAGLVVVNGEISNEVGELATKATEAGIKAGTPVVPVEKPSFEIETGFEVPKSKRGGGRTGTVYPFEKLEVGQSFFVAATEAKPEPHKSLGSTVSSAMARYDVADMDEATGIQKTKVIKGRKGAADKTVPAMKHTRVFTVKAAEKDGVKGARIWRTA